MNNKQFREAISTQVGFPSLLGSAEDERRLQLADSGGNDTPDRVEANSNSMRDYDHQPYGSGQ